MADLADIADECVHGLTAAWCSTCKASSRAAERRRRSARRKNAEGWGTENTEVSLDYPHTQARYDGLCPECDEYFSEGDWIYLVDGYWLDEECARDVTILNALNASKGDNRHG